MSRVDTQHAARVGLTFNLTLIFPRGQSRGPELPRAIIESPAVTFTSARGLHAVIVYLSADLYCKSKDPLRVSHPPHVHAGGQYFRP